MFKASQYLDFDERCHVVKTLNEVITDTLDLEQIYFPMEKKDLGVSADLESFTFSMKDVNVLYDSPHLTTSWARIELLPILKFEPAQPSLKNPPTLELKPLPDSLKYVFLGANQTLLVIIASNLTPSQESQLIEVLQVHKGVIGWIIVDLKRISPSICQHHIYLEENAKPSQEMQRRLNPNMKDVVKNEVVKWLDAGIIYLISDSKWVSPTQVVPKKSGPTMMKNE